ncbi:protein translocase subunit SecF [uncultured Ruthenibacterium sp.]|uniref:protein translocase subunit SecF n=1 Tax=uncultured Ruthenibacterium sp. TaxID=1905347 RepID=UPI00349EEB4B
MKTKGRPWHFFVVAVLIVVFAFTAFFGVSTQYGDTTKIWIKGAQNIRFGIDIRGGVDVTFMPADGYDATDEQMDAAKAIVEQRLVNLNITDNEVYADYDKDRIIVRFPWKEDETEFNPESAIQEIGATARLTFREGKEVDSDGKPTGVTAENIILEGSDIKSATAGVDGNRDSSTYGEYYVALELNDSGKDKFAEATKRLSEESPKGTISIWMDDTMISYPQVQTAITDGRAQISLNGSDEETRQQAITLANQINSGSLPFALTAETYSTISPSLGANSLDAMVLAGVIAFILVVLFMIFNYRLPGFVASIALLGQTAMTLAFVSGYFSVLNSFTLTLPGIAGIILAIGMGVDANVITAERIKEEIRRGKSIEGALRAGFDRGLTPIIDGNVTVIIVAVMLMGAFGPTDSFFAKLLRPIFFAFGPSTAGTIYSFGYTLLIGVLLNFVFGVISTRVMLKGISKLKFLRNPVLYGALKPGAPEKPKKEINIVGNRKKFFAFSSALLIVIVVFSLVFGVKMDIQFKGGAMITYSYTGEVDMNTVKKDVQDILGSSVTLQSGSSIASDSQTLTITLPGTETVETETVEALSAKLDSNYPDNAFEQLSMSNVDPTIGGEFFAKSLVGIAAAAVLILIYISIRFKKLGGWRGASMAIVALLNDMIVIFGIFAIFRIPLNGNFIAAMLTILGYSINDTVVIYDRIREDRSLSSHKHVDFAALVNTGINKSLRRTINTTLSTLLALGSVCVISVIFGLDSIFTFAFPLMIGMVSGVYSSVCIAGPLWVEWESRRKKGTKKKKATA